MALSQSIVSLLKGIQNGKYGSSISKSDIENYHDLEYIFQNGYITAAHSPEYRNPGYFGIELTTLGIQAIEASKQSIFTKLFGNWESWERIFKTTKWLGWAVGILAAAYVALTKM